MFAFTSIYMDFRDNDKECFVNKLVVTGVSVNGFIPLTDMLLTKKSAKNCYMDATQECKSTAFLCKWIYTVNLALEFIFEVSFLKLYGIICIKV